MKNYLLISITILCALIIGFLFGRYTSDTGRYYFKHAGQNSSLFDTNTGNLYQMEEGEMYLINYMDYYENDLEKINSKNKNK